MLDLGSMSRKEKIEYIWDYYKLHIISVIVIIIVLVSFIHGQLTKVDYVLNVTMIGNAVDESKRVELERKLTRLVVKEGEKRKQAFVEAMPADKSQIDPQMMQKFIVRVAAGEIDVVILDKGIFENFVKQDMFLPLDSIDQVNISAIKQNKIEGSSSNNKAVYAVSLQGNKTLEDMGFDTKDKVMSIMASSRHKDNGIAVFKEILNN